MPTIEITPEQAAALANGKSIVVDPPKTYRYIVVFTDSGNVWEFATQAPYEKIGWGDHSIAGKCTLLRAGAINAPVGYTNESDSRGGPGWVIDVTSPRYER